MAQDKKHLIDTGVQPLDESGASSGFEVDDFVYRYPEPRKTKKLTPVSHKLGYAAFGLACAAVVAVLFL